MSTTTTTNTSTRKKLILKTTRSGRVEKPADMILNVLFYNQLNALFLFSNFFTLCLLKQEILFWVKKTIYILVLTPIYFTFFVIISKKRKSSNHYNLNNIHVQLAKLDV